MIRVLNIKTERLPDDYAYIGRSMGGFVGSPLYSPRRPYEYAPRPELPPNTKRVYGVR
jgi:hypothetical protein